MARNDDHGNGRFKLLAVDFKMEVLEQVDDYQRQINIVRAINRRIRVLRDRSNPMEEFNDDQFRRRFRFSKDSTRDLANTVAHNLYRDARGAGLPVLMQLLIALRFYASGSFHIAIADFFGIHESTACRAVRRVSRAISALRRRFIYFPSRAQHPQVAARFSQISRSNFPGIIGAIDCTHIRIVAPSQEEAQRFYNRKHFYSINCQVICDADMHITNIVARWPGATHDSRIFRNSVIQNVLEEGRYEGHLIGDSGYPCKRYLLTPILRERNAADGRYNTAHRRARNVIERLFGIWKRRFPCLQYTLRTKIPTTQLIIIATSILHNYAIHRGEPDFDDELIPRENNDNHVGLPDERDIAGVNWRNQIVNMHFA